MRVNARLDKDLSAAVEQLLRKTGKTISEVMKEALALYLEARSRSRRAPSTCSALPGWWAPRKVARRTSRPTRSVT